MSPYEFDPDTNMNPINSGTQAFQEGQAAAAAQAQAQAAQPPPEAQAPNPLDPTTTSTAQCDKWIFDIISAFGRTCKQSTTYQQTTAEAFRQLVSSKESKVILSHKKEPHKFDGRADQVVS